MDCPFLMYLMDGFFLSDDVEYLCVFRPQRTVHLVQCDGIERMKNKYVATNTIELPA